jgi:hypothetical protein
MVYDTYFVVGIIILAFALPAIFRAIRRGNPPRISSVMLLIGGGLIVVAIGAKPNAYSISAIPQVFEAVISSFMAYLNG